MIADTAAAAAMTMTAAIVAGAIGVCVIEVPGHHRSGLASVLRVPAIPVSEVKARRRKKNEGEEQAGADDQQQVIEDQAVGFGDRRGGIQRIQPFQLGEQGNVRHHRLACVFRPPPIPRPTRSPA